MSDIVDRARRNAKVIYIAVAESVADEIAGVFVECADEIERLRAEGEQARAEALAAGQLADTFTASWRELQAENATLRAQLEAAQAEAARWASLHGMAGAPLPPHDQTITTTDGRGVVHQAAQALPPLPEGWIRESDECAENLGFAASWRGPLCRRVYLWPCGKTRIDANLPPADLITVLRHAEAAHQRLQEGQR